ncbi:hypothetical protein pb186bvf_019322 [Paramecium bursaria]
MIQNINKMKQDKCSIFLNQYQSLWKHGYIILDDPQEIRKHNQESAGLNERKTYLKEVQLKNQYFITHDSHIDLTNLYCKFEIINGMHYIQIYNKREIIQLFSSERTVRLLWHYFKKYIIQESVTFSNILQNDNNIVSLNFIDMDVRGVKTFAKNIYYKQKSRIQLDFFRELEIFRLVNHPGIIKLNKSIETEDAYHILYDEPMGGKLLDSIQQLTEPLKEQQIKEIIFSLAKTLDYLHSQYIYIGKMNLKSMLLEKQGEFDQVIITDLSEARIINQENKNYDYTSQFIPKQINNQNDFKLDIFILGQLFYLLLEGINPLQGIKGRLKQINFKNIFVTRSKHCWMLIQKMLEIDPSQRYSASQVLQHDWFKNQCLELKLTKMLNITQLEKDIPSFSQMDMMDEEEECSTPQYKIQTCKTQIKKSVSLDL